MFKSYRLILLGIMAVAMAKPAVAQEDGALRLYVTGGLQNSPASYDTFRPVEYDGGFQYGGGVALQLTRGFAVRGEFAHGSNGGFEAGVLNEDVEFERNYYGIAGELTLPVTFLLSPYLLGGVGLVSLDRVGPSYEYAFTESGGMFGGGVALPLGDFGADAFLQATGWAYPNSSTNEWQIDPILSIGLGYTIPF